MPIIRIRNEENQLQDYDVLEILRAYNAQLPDNVEGVRHALPLHTMMHSMRKTTRGNNPAIEITYRVTFDSRIMHITGHAFNRIPSILREGMRANHGIPIKELNGLDFKIKFCPTDRSVDLTKLILVRSGGRKILPNIYGEGRICFGSTQFMLGDNPTQMLMDVGRVLQSFFASTFNTDLCSTGANDKPNTKRAIIAFLQSQGKNTLANQVNSIDSAEFSSVYTLIGIAYRADVSLSDIMTLID